MLDTSMLEQLKGIFAGLVHTYTLKATTSEKISQSAELKEMIEEMASTSDKIQTEVISGDLLKLEILKDGQSTGMSFRAVPGGHEFTSLLLAILNADGKGKNLPDEHTQKRIAALKGPIHFKTYMSLSCTNCPDVVQALNIMTLINPGITHEAIDGSIYTEEAEALKIQAVPAVYAGDERFNVGKSSLGELLDKAEEVFGAEKSDTPTTYHFDLIVAGGGPGGAAAAIYTARKGRKVAVVAGRIGGQVNETVGIENLISVPYTTGSQLAGNIREHLMKAGVQIFDNRNIEQFEIGPAEETILHTRSGEDFVADQIIIATGASWRRLGAPGEAEYVGRGVAFCPHCDGPFYKDKDIVVIGGGNSGIEAAIDLAGIGKSVTVLEFMDSLKADQVLQDKARALPNISIRTGVQTQEIIGNGEKVNSMRIMERASGKEETIAVDGIFIQIGLKANSAAFADVLTVNRAGEIEVDRNCRTQIKGVYAAGDVTDTRYKQIIISMGEGAKAALSAFEDNMLK